MADYKEMYLKMVRATEQAINILIDAQRECEEMYLSAQESELKVITIQTAESHAKKRKSPPE